MSAHVRVGPWTRVLPLTLTFLLLVMIGNLCTQDRTTGFPPSLLGGLAFATLPDSADCISEGDTTVSFGGTRNDPDTLKTVIVWVSFEDSTSCEKIALADTLPSWFRTMETEFEDYFEWQSYGKLYVDATTAQHTGADSLRPWNLGKTPCYWRRVAGDPNSAVCPDSITATSEGCINWKVAQEIGSELGVNYFSDVDRVCFIHLGTAFTNDSVAGWGRIGYSCDNCVYSGAGTVQRPIKGVDDDPGDEGSTKWMLSHEYGHTLGLYHTPRSGQGATNTVFYGRYCNMQRGAPQPVDFVNNKFVPFHLWQISSLTSLPLEWFEDAAFDSISNNSLDVKVYDVRDVSDHNAIIVDSKVDTYDSEFWLIHHKNSEFDSLYGGALLAVWHMRNAEGGWPRDFDLELVTGKRELPCPDGDPDASAGWDSLECRVNRGHSSDLFADSGPDTLSKYTNPNTNDYADSDYPGTQSVETNVSIQDIRVDDSAGEPYVVDILFTSFGGGSPFLYAWNGKFFPRLVNVLAGLDYPESPHGGYETGSDYVVMSNPLAHTSGKYVLKIREDGESTNYLDQIEFLVVDHDADLKMTMTESGEIVGYENEQVPNNASGLPGNPLAELGRRGDPVYGGPGAAVVLSWSGLATEIGTGGVVLSSSGQENDEMSGQGGLLVQRPNGLGGWTEIARISPRSAFAEYFLADDDIGRSGEDLSLRIEWLDYHAVDFAAFVNVSNPSKWEAAAAVPDSAIVAYGSSFVEELAARDGSFAVLGPGEKLTVATDFVPPAEGQERTVILATHGYYVVPGPEGRPGGETVAATIAYSDGNRPNPFNPSTRIMFGLSRGADVSLGIYAVTGQLVRKLYEGPLTRGHHDFVWDGRQDDGGQVASGVYFYQLVAGGERVTGKMISVK